MVSTLKKRWLELAPKEDYPNTPEVTQELDKLQEAIKQLSTASPRRKVR